MSFAEELRESHAARRRRLWESGIVKRVAPTPPPAPPLRYMTDDEYAHFLVWTTLRNRGGHDKVKSICCVVAEHFGVAPEKLLNKGRKPELISPRHIAMYIVVNGMRYSLTRTAEAMGGWHHTAIMNACEKVTTRMQHDADFADLVCGFMRECKLIPTQSEISQR